MDKHEALDWFLRRRSMQLADKCQAAEDIAIDCIARAIDDGWNNVKDRLPKTDEDYYSRKTYIVSTVRGNVLAMEYVSKTIRGKAVKRWEWEGRISPWEVTHWMPLPEPPKEE